MSEVDLDQYLGSPDAHFNANAQGWYFEFTGSKKPDCDMSFEVFIAAVYELYLFVLENRDKPMACLSLVKEIPVRLALTDKDRLVIVKRLMGVLIQHPEVQSFLHPFMQILDYRHELSPFTEDPDVINHRWEFSFDEIKTQLGSLATTKEKLAYIINQVTDFKQKARQMDEFTLRYYVETSFVQNCADEIKRIKLLDSLDRPENIQSVPVKSGLSLVEKMGIAQKYLLFFSGYNYSGRKIMSDVDYSTLLAVMEAFLRDELVPAIIKPFPQIEVSNEFIRYTFYLIHKELFGTRQIRQVMIDLIHALFSQFAGTESATTKTKFSVKPRHYDTDSTYRS